MPLLQRILATALLLGWLFATGHIASEHGATVAGSGQHAAGASHLHDDHDHAPLHDPHAHDLRAAAQSARSLAVAAMWVPLHETLMERLAAMLREAAEPRARIAVAVSPLDQRSSGWLLVCQTARPVRGPSLG